MTNFTTLAMESPSIATQRHRSDSYLPMFPPPMRAYSAEELQAKAEEIEGIPIEPVQQHFPAVSPGPRLVRTNHACEHCRKRKAKCTGTQPCGRCKQSSLVCEYSLIEKKRKIKWGQPYFQHFGRPTGPAVHQGDQTMGHTELSPLSRELSLSPWSTASSFSSRSSTGPCKSLRRVEFSDDEHGCKSNPSLEHLPALSWPRDGQNNASVLMIPGQDRWHSTEQVTSSSSDDPIRPQAEVSYAATSLPLFGLELSSMCPSSALPAFISASNVRGSVSPSFGISEAHKEDLVNNFIVQSAVQDDPSCSYSE